MMHGQKTIKLYSSIYMYVNMYCCSHLTQLRIIYITRCQQRNVLVYQLCDINIWRVFLTGYTNVQMYYCKKKFNALMRPNAYRNCEYKIIEDYKILNKCAISWKQACCILQKPVLMSRVFVFLAGE
jgi:hypothetical protein